MLLTDHVQVNAVLKPMLNEFRIPNRTTTKLANKGRVGNWIEQCFGIDQNSDREADSAYAELKTMGISDRVARASIGNVTWDEFQTLKEGSQSWTNSDPYRKMERTLWVFWERVDRNPYDPSYKLRSWHYVDLKMLPDQDYLTLFHDFEKCREAVRRSSNYYNSRTESGLYLELGTKGDAQYVYPNWKFSTHYIRRIMQGDIGLTLSDSV
jgi:hypothetical protein